ncbi:MAG TPA: ABC transporter permease subunit [Terriglobia bacterium]|nr:ABC transporter permease subunit [Terriglobia bacterium]
MKSGTVQPVETPKASAAAGSAPVSAPARSISILRKRVAKFKTLRRGYYSFLVILAAYVVSFVLPLLISNKALAVSYNGNLYFPIARYHGSAEFGLDGIGEPNYRQLKETLAGNGKGWVLMPPYPFSPTESLLDLPGSPPHRPSWQHIFGTDDRGRDVFARLAYGFNVSLTFALLVLTSSYFIGIPVGALLGYYSGKLDILGQRFIEIWSSLPFLYTIIIISSIVVPVYVPGRNVVLQPSFWLLIGILAVFDWMGITYYIRGEFYREKAKDYVGAAIAMGVSERAIIMRHILPNALTPVVSFAPFAIVGNIGALVALDFLGFGLPAPTPSWGELVGQGISNLGDWWLVLFPLGALFVTLLLIVFIGEAVREAFDPKEYSRLR